MIRTFITLFCAIAAWLNTAAELPAMKCDRLEYGFKTAYTEWFDCETDGSQMQVCVKYIDNRKNPMLAVLYRADASPLYSTMVEFIEAVRNDESSFLSPDRLTLALSGTEEWTLTNDADFDAIKNFVVYDWDNDAEARVACFMLPLNLMVSEQSKWKYNKSKILINSIEQGRIDRMSWTLGNLRRKSEMKQADIPLPARLGEITTALIQLHKNTK